MEVLIFDIYGDYAHFKKFYTTSSPLTFSFPPPPTVKGILGAISGVDKSKYLDTFSSEQCYIAIRIISPVEKTRMGINLINTKGNFWQPVKRGSHEARTQIRTEFLKHPAYRVYFMHKDQNLMKDLKNMLQFHKTVYTVSLGLSELLADFKYSGPFSVDVVDSTDNPTDITTIIPLSLIDKNGITFEEGKKYFKERIPVDMTQDRVVKRYENALMEISGKSIKAKLKKYWQTENGECITFF
ncbi:MAG: type I-B CRISPR-associated protein Cas5 [Caldisericum sp. CG2_30_36_11]|nr:type I-B CRISPR-associated protein Cas5 [Caldisericota bacterium]OIP13909.1 MAG: type I-B CRISPR-associated protein Cas5 [Caldisericum sp. CG2_30_36_11]PIX29830.1 MAG: type I-B CRISPR-associated protein Cas5 [Caldiserica bacterium CG_4_8_14_3_um_filter_35_18]